MAHLPVGARGGDVEFDPGRQVIYSADDGGMLTIVREDSPDKFSVVERIRTRRGAGSMALDSSAHQVFLATADFEHPVVQDRNRIRIGSHAVWVLGAPEIAAEAAFPKPLKD